MMKILIQWGSGMIKSEHHYVYILKFRDSYKVGIAKDPKSRIKQLNRKLFDEVEPLVILRCESTTEARAVEKAAHEYLQSENVKFIDESGEIYKFGGYTEFFIHSLKTIKGLVKLVRRFGECEYINTSHEVVKRIVSPYDWRYQKWINEET